MKIKELLKHEYAFKLKKYSFFNRQLNKDILAYHDKVLVEFQFVEREVDRAKSECKTKEELEKAFKEIEEIEIEDIPRFKLKDSDFDECFLPQDKNNILLEEDIQLILKWCDSQQKDTPRN